MWEISEYKYITSKSKLNCCMYNCLLYFIFSDVLNEFSLTLVPKFYFDIETLLHTCDNEQFTLVYACEKKSELSMFKDTWVVGTAFDKGTVSFSVSF